MFERLPTPFGPRARRRRARPPEDQVGDARVREDRAQAGLPLLRQRRGRPRHHPRGAAGAPPRRHLRGRLADDRRLGIPGEELPGAHAGDASSSPGTTATPTPPTRVRPRRRAGRRDRQRQRRARRRAHARAHARGARADRHRRPRDRRAARLEVEEIVVLGRRGPAQAAFTNPELRELGELADADVVVDPAELALDAHSAALARAARTPTRQRRNVEIAAEYAARAPRASRRRIVLRFLVSPVEIIGEDRVEGVSASSATELVPRADGALSRADRRDREPRVRPGVPLDRLPRRAVAGLPFDERRGTDPQRRRARRSTTTATPMPGVYAAGWIKRGPIGRDRHEQEVRAGDRRRAARGPRGGPAADPPADASTLIAALPSAHAERGRLRGLGGASTPTSSALGEPRAGRASSSQTSPR